MALGESDVDDATKQQPQLLATAGRLLQSHFSPTTPSAGRSTSSGPPTRTTCTCCSCARTHDGHPPRPGLPACNGLLLWLPIFYVYQRDIGLTDQQIFGVQAIYYVAFCLLDVPTGMLADRFDYRRFLQLGAGTLTVAVIPTNAAGEPWSTQPLWRPDDVDWSSIVTPGTKLEEVPAFSMPKNQPAPVYDPSGGSRNWLGLFVVTAPDAHQLHRDCHAILNGLEAGLNSVPTDR